MSPNSYCTRYTDQNLAVVVATDVFIVYGAPEPSSYIRYTIYFCILSQKIATALAMLCCHFLLSLNLATVFGT